MIPIIEEGGIDIRGSYLNGRLIASNIHGWPKRTRFGVMFLSSVDPRDLDQYEHGGERFARVKFQNGWAVYQLTEIDPTAYSIWSELVIAGDWRNKDGGCPCHAGIQRPSGGKK